MHLGQFGSVTKLGAKRAELVQKFVPRSRVGIFRNEHIRSSPLDLKLMFWCVSYYLGVFGTIWLPYETRGKTGRTRAKVRATKSHRNFLQQTYQVHPIRPQTDVLVCFVLFGCILDCFWLPYKTRCKTVRTSAKVRATKSRRNFLQRMLLIDPIGP